MAPIRSAFLTSRRRSSLSLLSTRRKSLVPPKNYTFAQNLTPISYPSDRSPSTDDDNTSPDSSDSPLSPTTASSSLQGPASDTKPSLESMSAVPDSSSSSDTTMDLPMPPPTKPRRRGPRRDSVEHIPRPPNAFMLFRQNFVHQRHVPGSIETNHNSLSRIVGNHWKALPASEKKRWESLADKKKEEHKRMYPDYRFQPKHDPEKKRRRQEAKAAAEAAAIREEQQRHAEEVRRQNQQQQQQQQRELEFDGPTLAMPIPMSSGAMGGLGVMDEAQQNMQLRRNQDRERRAQQHLIGHRRSSSVPLPMESYAAAAAYPFGVSGGSGVGGGVGSAGGGFPPAYNAQAQSNPFNFANPALGANSNGQAGPIAIPTIPTMGGAQLSNLSGMVPSWYSQSNANNAEQPQHSQSAGATPLSGELQLPPNPFDTISSTSSTNTSTPSSGEQQQQASSPRLAASLRANTNMGTPSFAPQGMGMLGSMAMYNQLLHNPNVGMGMGGMNSFGMNNNNMGMNMTNMNNTNTSMNMSGMNNNMGMSGMNMGMGGMGMSMGVSMGMGARAARQHQLGQLGRRASSTQPVLQHQLASGAFVPFTSGSTAFNFASPLPLPASAMGFTNPFAATSATAPDNSGNGNSSDNASTDNANDDANRNNAEESTAQTSFPHPFAPHAIWYESTNLPSPSAVAVGGVPQSTASQPEPLPEVDSSLLNPEFRFGAATAAATSANSVSTNDDSNAINGNENASAPSDDNGSSSAGTSSNEPSAPPSAVNAEFPRHALAHGHGLPLSAGPRNSFDFTAIMMNLPGANANANSNANANANRNTNAYGYAGSNVNVDVSISPLENIPPHQRVPVPALAQPIPMRKAVVPDEYAYAQHQHQHQHQQLPHQLHQQHQQEYVPTHIHHPHQMHQYVLPQTTNVGVGMGGGMQHQEYMAAPGAGQEYYQNSQPSSVASGSPSLSAVGTGSAGAGSPHAFQVSEMEMHHHQQQQQVQVQSRSQETTPTEMHPHARAGETVAGTELLDGSYAQDAQQQQQAPQQPGVAYPEPMSASLGGSMESGALGLYPNAHPQQHMHGEALQSYYTAAAGVCSGVDVLDNYRLGMNAYGAHGGAGTEHPVAHSHAYPDQPSAGFEFSDFVHDSPYLGAAAN